MRYLLNAKVRPERQADLLRALEDGSFGDGFPYGDLGEMICTGRVDEAGVIRWVEVCYCRESPTAGTTPTILVAVSASRQSA
jgi:hypothetical protein